MSDDQLQLSKVREDARRRWETSRQPQPSSPQPSPPPLPPSAACIDDDDDGVFEMLVPGEDDEGVVEAPQDVHELFRQYNTQLFNGALDAVAVSWSTRMKLCAGTCEYQERAGFVSIKLSEPLLKFRPNRDCVATLLHEMIHAYLFVTHDNRDHEDHGPEFRRWMETINVATGAHVTVCHSFEQEVDFYRTHWWMCDGRCRGWPPYFGVVKRSSNRAPGPNDLWWARHQARCGGVFTKVKEPDPKAPKKRKKTSDAKGHKGGDEDTDAASTAVPVRKITDLLVPVQKPQRDVGRPAPAVICVDSDEEDKGKGKYRVVAVEVSNVPADSPLTAKRPLLTENEEESEEEGPPLKRAPPGKRQA